MPAAAHAPMKREFSQSAVAAKAASGSVAAGCEHHAKTASANKQAPKGKSCCNHGPCGCATGSCHSGFSAVLGVGKLLALASCTSKTRFVFANEYDDSALSECLIRPPRA